MKKVLLCFVAVALTAGAFAQHKSQFGVRAGVNLTNLGTWSDGNTETLDAKINFHVGGVYELPIIRNFYFGTGLYFMGFGAKSDAIDVNTYYLQVPASIGWHIGKRKFSFQPAIGGYYGFGVGGKVKQGGVSVNAFEKNEGVRPMKRSDAGVRLVLGATYNKHYYFGLGFEVGLMNIGDNLSVNGPNYRNINSFITLGYNF